MNVHRRGLLRARAAQWGQDFGASPASLAGNRRIAAALLLSLVNAGYGLEVLMLWFIPSRLIQLVLGFSFFWLPHVPHKDDTRGRARRVDRAGGARMSAYRRFRCRYCSHVYDERLGDPDRGIPPGTRFEGIPADRQCPECGASKSDYEPCDGQAIPE